MSSYRKLKDLVINFDDGVEEEIKKAISFGDDVNQNNEKGYSLLMLAAMSCSSGSARVLLEAGADPNETRDNSLCSMFERGLTPFLYSIIDGVPETVQLMLEHGADIYAQNSMSSRALDLAAGNGDKSKIELLLNYFPDLDHQDIDGKNAVMVAAESGHFKCLKLLITAGSRLDLISKNNENIIELAASPEVEVYLRAECASIDFPKPQKETENPKDNCTAEEVLNMLNTAQKMMRNPLWRLWYKAKIYFTGKRY